MYFWLMVVVLSAGIFKSFFVYGKKVFPLLVSIMGAVDIVLMQKGSIGPIGLTVLAVLAMVIWGANIFAGKIR